MSGLDGRTVVITRAAHQADDTAVLAASFGANVLVIPVIEVVDDEAGVRELAELDIRSFDWLLVTSPNGAGHVVPRLAANETTPKVAAVGTATATALPRCDLVAGTQSADGLLAVFPSGPGRALVVQAAEAARTLVDGLRIKGWDVVVVSPYRTNAVVPAAADREAALAADAVLFASGSAARAWAAAFGPNTPAVVVAIGEQTADAASAAGLKVTLVSADHSVRGMLVSLSRYFSSGN